METVWCSTTADARPLRRPRAKTIGRPERLAEQRVFYGEQVGRFRSDTGPRDEGHFDASARRFEQAIKVWKAPPATRRADLRERLGAAPQQPQRSAAVCTGASQKRSISSSSSVSVIEQPAMSREVV